MVREPPNRVCDRVSSKRSGCPSFHELGLVDREVCEPLRRPFEHEREPDHVDVERQRRREVSYIQLGNNDQTISLVWSTGAIGV